LYQANPSVSYIVLTQNVTDTDKTDGQTDEWHSYNPLPLCLFMDWIGMTCIGL